MLFYQCCGSIFRQIHRRFPSVSVRFKSTIITPTPTFQNVRSDDVLYHFIKDKIRVDGPITIAQYMELCLSAPNVGYYTSLDRTTIFGSSGDFVTSPEISQMFGELCAVWVFYEMAAMGHHRRPWQLVELGPGSGVLMEDMLKALKRFSATQMLSVHVVEVSDSLAKRQESLLCGENKGENGTDDTTWCKRNISTFGCPIYWYKELREVPEKFSFYVAHEFFDALPVHKFQRVDERTWREVYVDWDRNEDKLRFSLAPVDSLALKAHLPEEIRQSKDFDVWEVSPKAGQTVSILAERLVQGGGALIVDYGHNGDRKTSSLRAYKKHELVDFLLKPGHADLTADVNFGYLKSLIEDQLISFGPITQKDFLMNLGIEVRFQALLDNANGEKEKNYLKKSYDWITNPEQMGEKFKVMSLFPKVLDEIFESRKLPAGFTPLWKE